MTSNDVQQTPPEGSSGVHPVNISIHHDVTVPQTAVNSVVGQQHQANGTGPQPVIVVRDLKKTYLLGETRVQALRGVSLQVQQGEFVAVMGPSGSGKTTLMNLLGCLDRPSSGDYLLAGKMVSRMSPDELALIRNQLIGFVFQGFNLLSRATAVKNVAMPLMYAGYSKEEQEYRARKALQLVGLGSRLHHRPSQLSGGQQQRVAIARALVNSPSLLLADEPTGNLDSRTSIEIMAVLQALNQRGLTIILVTHEPDIAAYARRQVVFRDGLLVRDEVMHTSRNAITELSVEKEPTHIVTQEAAE
ncbi:MAG TPA: ABC transporter ATP-binding protein [Ktedonosporobacter sp.]|jgi:putative ABC transport system ATP-binding protein|nr:ABC transporter ATP-binding protein [Ktedonosporobacter sp.]